MTIVRLLCLAALALACGTTGSAAQDAYPNRTIQLFVPWPPGGALDAITRIVQPGLSRQLGQSIVIDNRSGANGTVGTAVVARSQPDGHVLMATIEAHLANQSLYQNLPYNALNDFVPIARIASTPILLVAHPSFPANDVPSLVRLAKEKPKTLSFGSIGVGSQHHLVGTMFSQRAGLDLVHVPYRGGGPAINDLVAGHIPMMFLTVASVTPLMKDGRVKVLAALSRERLPDFPNVPTMAEAGFPEVEAATWFGLMAPRGTPPEVVAKIYHALDVTLQEDEVKRRLAGLGVQPSLSKSPEEFATFVKGEFEKYERIIRANNITLN